MKTKGFLSIDNVIFFGLFSLCIVVISLKTNRESLILSQIINTLQEGQQILGSSLAKTSKNIKDFSTLFAVQEQNKVLTKKLSLLLGIEKRLQGLQRENDYLRSQLTLSKNTHYKVLHAEVLARNLRDFISTVILSKGYLDGIKKGMIVISHNLHQDFYGLVGRIVEVNPHSSHVRLAFHEQFYITSKVEKNGVSGIFHGGGDSSRYGSLKYVNVKNFSELNINDLILTNGIDDISISQEEREILYPKGIYIGHIRKIKLTSYQPSLDIELSPAVNFAKLKLVLIITDSSRQEGNFL